MRDYNEVNFKVDEENVTLEFWLEVDREVAEHVESSETVKNVNMMDETDVSYIYYIPGFLKFNLEQTKEVISILQDSVIKRHEEKGNKIKRLLGIK